MKVLRCPKCHHDNRAERWGAYRDQDDGHFRAFCPNCRGDFRFDDPRIKEVK